MKAQGEHYRTIWIHPDHPEIVQIIDQRDLPHRFVHEPLTEGPSKGQVVPVKKM
ncbi:MAG: S-methyl-5-thioribose-1-phosphate isomerase, partial [Propionibacteriaceae bacterium]|nr:S-methyl-5-thioribose-1-phosphate isomerase [Propionibacteriaceae bacterium]